MTLSTRSNQGALVMSKDPTTTVSVDKPARVHAPATDKGTPARPGATRRLRRWSVAELIARAVASPPATT
jgi:hypothetical protein